MKKTIFYLSAMVLTLAGGQLAFAQEEAQSDKPDWRKDFSVTIGVKVWMNKWQIDRFFGESVFIPIDSRAIDINTTNNAPDTQISDIEPTPIPQLAVRYKQLFITGSYYAKTDFDFPTVRQDGTATLRDVQGNTTFLSSRTAFTTTTGERWEWDAAAGWYVHPYVAFLVGYKEINVETGGTITGTDTFINPFTGVLVTNPFPSTTFSSKIEISGPTLGIAGTVPIAGGFGMYASYAHGFMDVDIINFGEPESDADADYDVAELGFTYTYGTKTLLPHVPLSAATFYAGYRYQTIETDIPDELGGDRRDITQGFAAGLNLTW